MTDFQQLDFSYFPGCSMATTAIESTEAMTKANKILGFNLIELEDWNCCGSSSTSALCKELSLAMVARNLSLAPPGRPLVAMCPRCLHYLRYTQAYLQKHPDTKQDLENHLGRKIPDLEIMHYLEVLVRFGLDRLKQSAKRSLKGLKFMPYYGCMVFRPPELQQERDYEGEMANILAMLGGKPVVGALTHRCCGSFLSATDPGLVTPIVNEIMSSGVAAGADCLITACAMCQLNLEMRCTIPDKLPVFHFSEILALALGVDDTKGWFIRHLIDPQPLLQKLALVA